MPMQMQISGLVVRRQKQNHDLRADETHHPGARVADVVDLWRLVAPTAAEIDTKHDGLVSRQRLRLLHL